MNSRPESRDYRIHVPSQPSFFPPCRDPGGMLSRLGRMLRRNEKTPDNLGYAWYFRRTFL